MGWPRPYHKEVIAMTERLLFPNKKAGDKGITLQEFAETMAMSGLLANIDITKAHLPPDAIRINCKSTVDEVVKHVYPNGFEL